ncbi:MAG: hypothetical protein WCI57_00890 [Candidatus Berkelbacteria bacterium]
MTVLNIFKEMNNFVYEGLPFKGHVHVENPYDVYFSSKLSRDELTDMTPVVFRTLDHEYGVGVCLPDGLVLSYSCGKFNDIICLWRMIEILPFCGSVSRPILPHLVNAVIRQQSSQESLLITLSKLIVGDCKSIYRNVMSKKVPEEIIRLILESQSGPAPMNLNAITEESISGTIEWREDFAKAGAIHPDEWGRIVKEREELIKRYEKYILDYLSYGKKTSNQFLLDTIAEEIVLLVEDGLEEKYSPMTVSALAIIFSYLLEIRELLDDQSKDQPSDESVVLAKRLAIKSVSTWLTVRERPWWKPFVSEKAIVATIDRLEEICKEYFLPETND